VNLDIYNIITTKLAYANRLFVINNTVVWLSYHERLSFVSINSLVSSHRISIIQDTLSENRIIEKRFRYVGNS
jgi:hypothetical protein